MGIWSFLFGTKITASEPLPVEATVSPADRADHLGRAASAKHRGRKAVADGRYDEAWCYFHEQKEHYLRHAKRYGMTPRQSAALDGSVHEDLANIRRLEIKHDEALVHLLYCVATNLRPTKAQTKKLTAYVGRCGFAGVTSDGVNAYVQAARESPDLSKIQAHVRAWRGNS